MQQEIQDSNKAVARPTLVPPGNKPPTANGSGRTGNAQRFGGMHLRRDKRFPFAQRYLPDTLPPTPAHAEPPSIAEDPLKLWKEAVMLWLSWHSTQEKLTAKMCKPGQDQKKIETLLDEADELRNRAIELSELLVRQ